MERRLAAILAADVVGYSRLMEIDEAGTLGALTAHRKELVDPKIAEHNGRIVKLMGDGALVEFPSVVEAVNCAVAIQKGMAERNAGIDGDRHIAFRIGINIGDVIVESEDIYGDGVNIAARLEGLAEPGGICVSRVVRDQIRDKLDIGLDDLGEIKVKNIARPVRAFRLVAEPSTTASARRRGTLWLWPTVAGIVAMIVAMVGVVAWLRPWTGMIEMASIERPVDLPAIAVLPFDNMSGDPEQDYFSDGITEDLITDLSQVSGLRVIARSTMFAYKGKDVNAQQIGHELGVQFVLEGSVRRAGEQVRVNAQLIDVGNGFHVWADRHDRGLADVFALQDEITHNIVKALSVKLTTDEAARLRRSTKAHPEAYDALLRGLAELRRYTPETAVAARGFFEQAIGFDPDYARAYGNIAYSLAFDVINGYSANPEETLQRAAELADTALRLDDTIPQVHFARSTVFRAQRRLDDAVNAARNAVALDPNYADAYAALAMSLNYAGQPEGGLQAIEQSIRLNPGTSFFELAVLAQSYFLLGRYDDAIRELQKVVEGNPAFLLGRKLLAATYGQAGRIDDAEWEASEILNLKPDLTLANERERTPYGESDIDRYIDGLRKAGLPE